MNGLALMSGDPALAARVVVPTLSDDVARGVR
jgi:hypothetical protein